MSTERWHWERLSTMTKNPLFQVELFRQHDLLAPFHNPPVHRTLLCILVL
jgi:hypothetical protein